MLAVFACKKIPVRTDLLLELQTIDGQTPSQNMIYDVQSGEEHTLRFRYQSASPLKTYRVLSGEDDDLSAFLLNEPAEGSLSGTFDFRFAVDDLIPQPVAGGIPQYRSVNVSMLDEQGSVATFSISIRKTE